MIYAVTWGSIRLRDVVSVSWRVPTKPLVVTGVSHSLKCRLDLYIVLRHVHPLLDIITLVNIQAHISSGDCIVERRKLDMIEGSMSRD